MRQRAACTRSAMRGGRGSGQPETACGFTPTAFAAAVVLPPKRLMASDLSMPKLNHAFILPASIVSTLFCNLPFMDFGDRLQTALDLAKKDRRALAEHLGISVQAVGQTVTGKTKNFTAANTARAARFLGVNWYWLATGEETPAVADGVKLTSEERGVLERVLKSATPIGDKDVARPHPLGVTGKNMKRAKSTHGTTNRKKAG